MTKCLTPIGSNGELMPPARKGELGRRTWTLAGALCVGLGAVGMVLPLMPTTPFLLLAAGCFARGSPRALRWLVENPLFGQHLKGYREGRGLSARAKIVSIAAVISGICLSISLTVPGPLVMLLLVIVAIAVTVHMLSLPTSGRGSGEGP